MSTLSTNTLQSKVGLSYRLRRFGQILWKDLYKNKTIYLLLLPAVLYYLVFHYYPMYGAQIAFKNFSPGKGIMGSPWAGFEHFFNFFKSYYFWRLIGNTLIINFYDLIFGFPAPIILALLLGEVKKSAFRRSIQTVTYLPHFISTVVLCGIILDFASREGLFNSMITFLGNEPIMFMIEPSWFQPIFVSSGIWQQVGWGSIIYLAALSNVDQELYEAAKIDGANRLKQILNVTIPCILPTIVIMFILRIGHMMNVGSDKVLLLYNAATYETADVISTFVYRKGLVDFSFSYASAVGLFNSIINFILLISCNKLSRKLTDSSLW